MPIPFRDVDDAPDLGSAAFLEIEHSPDATTSIAALFVISARGEPLEFAYNRVVIPNPFLWQPDALRRHVQRRLVTSLFSICTHQPRLLLCQEDAVDVAMFQQDLQVEMPIAVIGGPPVGTRKVDPETGEVFSSDEDDREEGADPESPPRVAWLPAPPLPDSPERLLFDHLAAHGLLREPFERAAIGLQEVYDPNPREPA